MRSRYTAFAVGNEKHLRWTWHPDHLPRDFQMDPSLSWLGLEIVATKRGQMHDQTGEVTFIARYEHNGAPGQVRERSSFERVDGRWVYVTAQ